MRAGNILVGCWNYWLFCTVLFWQLVVSWNLGTVLHKDKRNWPTEGELSKSIERFEIMVWPCLELYLTLAEEITASIWHRADTVVRWTCSSSYSSQGDLENVKPSVKERLVAVKANHRYWPNTTTLDHHHRCSVGKDENALKELFDHILEIWESIIENVGRI